MTTPNPDEVRFVVRQRGDGYAVWDSEERSQVDLHDTKKAAERDATTRNNEPRQHTYGLTYYVEVDASDPADAIVKSKRYFALGYRENWDPVEVTELPVDGS